jgi:hypothetical protein
MSLYAISFLLNHDSYFLNIRSDVIIFLSAFVTGEEGVIGSAWSQWKFAWKSNESTLWHQKCQSTPRWHVACSSRAIATRRRRHTVKKPFRSAADTVGLSVPQAQGARLQKKFQQSREDHERLAELDMVHNQAFTNSPPPSTPPPPLGALPLLPPAPLARVPPAPQLLRGKTSKVHCTG